MLFPFEYNAALPLAPNQANIELLTRVADGLRATGRCRWVRQEGRVVVFRSGISLIRFTRHPLAAVTNGTVRIDQRQGPAVLEYRLTFMELILYSLGLLAIWAGSEAWMFGHVASGPLQSAALVFVLFCAGNLGYATWWFRRFLKRKIWEK